MNSQSNKLEAKFLKRIRGRTTKYYYYDIKQLNDKFFANLKKNVLFDNSDTILAVIDTSLGSGKTGMIIGLNGIYFKNNSGVKSYKNFLLWEELKQIKAIGWMEHRSGDISFGNVNQFGDTGIFSIKKDFLISLLTDLYRIFENETITNT